jgi:hypothetical protein
MAKLLIDTRDLSNEEVRKLVYSYEDPQVTDELYSFGQMLLTEVQQRAGQIDSKATTILGWATAILAFLFTQLDKTGGAVDLGFGSAVAGLTSVAVISSYCALRAREGWRWPSDRDWFQKAALCKGDELKRFHLRSIHDARRSQRDLTERKARFLIWGQRFLMLGSCVLALGLGVKLFSAFTPTLGECVRIYLDISRWMAAACSRIAGI